MAGSPTKLSFSLGSASTAKKPPPGGLGFSFSAKAGPSTTSKQPTKSSAAFGFGDEEEEEDDAHRSNGNAVAGPSRSGTIPRKSATGPSSLNPSDSSHKASLLKQAPKLSRAARKVQEEAVKVDASVFEYDEVFDGMKEAQRQVERKKEEESAERKPKYIDAFLASAKQRNLDKLRAEEKMLQHERDREGDEFADKDKFVTGAYKKQMEEVRRAEEEEREKEERDRKSKTGPGMTTFYRNMLDADEERHAAAMAAASASSASKAAKDAAGPSLAIKPPSAPTAAPTYDPEPESDAYLRREAAMLEAASATAGPVRETLPATNVATDERVEVNDDGAIVDHRVLLKAGLNITKKPIAPMPGAADRRAPVVAERYVSRAVGAAATPAERAARERARLAGLVKEEEERRTREAREKEQAEEDAARRRSEASKSEEGERKRKEARERFEQRKRQRLAETTSGEGS